MAKPNKKDLRDNASSTYQRFDKIDGRHPFKKSCPDSYIEYPARIRRGGKVAFFNFELAKTMGLIDKDHPTQIPEALEKKILETFSLMIINEYDEMNNIEFPKEDVKKHKYMATRYLQLQHPNKKGLTSGDGRSVWNGHISYKGKTWDLSSSGTGATRLSPATALQNKFFQSGDPSISYGCGYSEIDEGLSTLFFSEVFSQNGLGTERILAIIEYPKGISINVRVHENLLRPSHLFCQMKQGNYQALKNLVDYYIERQEANQVWSDVPKTANAKYKYFLKKQTEIFAKLSAHFEDHYIFCWLDWDGDNILMDGSIIDYGSIRQFGLFHHEYRYDDVQRYSTSILEQKQKAKYIVQTFAQITDFLITKDKKNISEFSKSEALKDFDEVFSVHKDKNLLYKIGFSPKDQELLFTKHRDLVDQFRKPFSYFEMSKSKKGVEEVADGINWSAIYCMRDILRELPQILLARGDSELENDEFIEIIKSNYITDGDLEENKYRDRMIKAFQQSYKELIYAVCLERKIDVSKLYLEVSMRSSVINKYDRVTGDSITTVVQKILKTRPKLGPLDLFKMMKEFSYYQNLDPDKKSRKKEENAKEDKLFKGLLRIVREYREGL